MMIVLDHSSAHHLNPDWVALNVSRGYESYQHKLFMRYTGELVRGISFPELRDGMVFCFHDNYVLCLHNFSVCSTVIASLVNGYSIMIANGIHPFFQIMQ